MTDTSAETIPTPPQYVYLSGPMTGIKDYNFPAFHAAAEELRDRGFEVFNPAETDEGDTTKTRAHYMRQDVKALLEVGAIVLLSGWQTSKGAQLEVSIARELGLPIRVYPDMALFSESVLAEADRLVSGERQTDYGHPYEDFSRTAKIWSAIVGTFIPTYKVPLMMVGVKLSRECNQHSRDNNVDGPGYWKTNMMVHERLEALGLDRETA